VAEIYLRDNGRVISGDSGPSASVGMTPYGSISETVFALWLSDKVPLARIGD
jgi:hypothetical protein